MKHIKPGRGPSAMGAMGAVFTALFGVIWTVAAASMGAPWFFPLFGVVFIIMAVVQGIYNFKNATGRNRYSDFDIVDSAEEPDPWNQRFGGEGAEPWETADAPEPPEDGAFRYCPYCGAKLGDGFTFCSQCGKKLPDEL